MDEYAGKGLPTALHPLPWCQNSLFFKAIYWFHDHKCSKLAKSGKIVENEVFRLFRCSKLPTKTFRIFSRSSYVWVWKLVKIVPWIWEICSCFGNYTIQTSLVEYDGCKRTGSFHYLHWKAELFHVFQCDEFNCKFKLLTRNGCVYKVFKLLLIESRLFLEVSQKVEKTLATLWIISLHIMCKMECKNDFLKFQRRANNRQFCHISKVVHKFAINCFL